MKRILSVLLLCTVLWGTFTACNSNSHGADCPGVPLPYIFIHSEADLIALNRALSENDSDWEKYVNSGAFFKAEHISLFFEQISDISVPYVKTATTGDCEMSLSFYPYGGVAKMGDPCLVVGYLIDNVMYRFTVELDGVFEKDEQCKGWRYKHRFEVDGCEFKLKKQKLEKYSRYIGMGKVFDTEHTMEVYSVNDGHMSGNIVLTQEMLDQFEFTKISDILKNDEED